MRGLPQIGSRSTSRKMTDVFAGYRNAGKIADGEWSDTENLTSGDYPMMASRKPRGVVGRLAAPGGLLEKKALAIADNGTLYFNGLATGLTGLSSGEKQMVSMGAYVCIWPDKKYYNTENPTDFGSMEASAQSSGHVEYVMCRSDGSEFDNVTISDSEPAPGSCDVWIDTSSSGRPAMEYSQSYGGWVQIPRMYTKVKTGGLGIIPGAFAAFDGVSISGSDFDEINGEKVIYSLGGGENEADWFVVAGMLDSPFVQEDNVLHIERRVPELDYVCECQNRLWGCFYGNADGKNINEIYCCALGDFKNWRQYRGLSTDSWTASVGSDGQWTGAVNYLGHPVFFKENIIHKVTVSAAGAHQISETICRGVQKGSWRSLQVVDETLYYKSRVDVCAWQGGFPETVSAALGDRKYYQAAAGAFGGRYYISMKDEANAWHLFVYDIKRGLWLREDALHALCFAKVDDELYCINAENRDLVALNGTTGTAETSVHWRAVSGMMYYEYPDKKYLSRFNLRLQLAAGASISVYLEYDSDGRWIPAGTITRPVIGTVTLPVRPRRCDHMRMKLEGEGAVKLYSIARILEVSSDQ